MQNGPIEIKKYFCKGCKFRINKPYILPNGKPLLGDLFFCSNEKVIKSRGKSEPVYLSDSSEFETPEDCPYLGEGK